MTDPRSLKLGFAGTPEFAVPALDALNDAYGIRAVFTQPDRPAGRGQPLRAGPVKARAAQLGLKLHQPASFRSPEALEMLRALELDVLVVVAYGLILPPAALACPKLGCINIHASLLPRWRGAAPIQRVLLAGDATTGVTIMRMDVGLDTGPMLAARAIDIGDADTGKSLHDRLARLGADLIVETIDAVRDGRSRQNPQPTAGVTYAEEDQQSGSVHRLAPGRGGDLAAHPRVQSVADCGDPAEWRATAHVGRRSASNAGSRSVRAHSGNGARRHAGGHRRRPCGRGVLRVLRLQLAGRKPLPARDFIRGRRLDGACLAPS